MPEIGLIMVHPAMQGHGIARALLHHAVEEMQTRGCDVIESGYRLVSDQARQWYQRQGFTELPNRLSARLLAQRADSLMASASTSEKREKRAREYEALEWLARRT
jgi:ribosomal protein S18 acetylase RimI-like enzyme